METVWIVLADAARARILSCEGRACHGLKDVEALSHSESRAYNRDLVTDRPGRSWASASGDARHGMDEPTDPAQRERERFARQVADRLLEAFREGAYKRLVIIAAPTFLGVLRDLLDRNVAQAVCLELAKNIVKIDEPASLRAHLPDFLY